MSPSSRKVRRGASALEFALAVPLLLGFLLAIVDIGRYVLTVQNASSAATAAADLASQTESFTPQMDVAQVVTGREIAVLSMAAAEVARPVDLTADGAVIVTLVANAGLGPAVSWQRRWGRADIASRVGPGALRGIVIGPGESAVYAEVACNFRPWLLSGRLLGLADTWAFHVVAVRRPRLGGPVILP
jgi:hypothetical protein